MLDEHYDPTRNHQQMDSEIRRIAEEVRRNLISEIQDSDETAENKKALITLFSEMSILEFLQVCKFPEFMEPKDNTEGDKAIIRFVPPFSNHPLIKTEKGGNTGISLVNESTVHVSWRIRPGYYFNIYFMKMSETSFKACCCFGSLINHLWNSDVCQRKALPAISSTTKKLYPEIISSLCLTKLPHQQTKPYLNTIGFNSQPKQWHLMQNVNDSEEWVDLRLYGPTSDKINNVINDMYQSAARIAIDIYNSGNSRFVEDFEKFIGFSFLKKQ